MLRSFRKRLRKLAALPRDLRFRSFARQHPEVAAMIGRVLERRLSYLGREELLEIAGAVLRNERQGVEGGIVEAGCALGGSALVIASAKRPDRPFAVYDVFGLIPPPSDRDGTDVHERYQEIVDGKARGIRGETYYGYEEDLYQKVQGEFEGAGLDLDARRTRLVRGLFADTLQIEEPVSLVHLDCDWYESVMTCLERIEPRLAPGGTLIVDDYYSWSGCREAVDEYFSGSRRTAYRFLRRKRLHIIKR